MSNPKGQHYVPKTHLSNFVDPDSPEKKPYFWVVSKDGKSIRKGTPEQTFRENHIYTYELNNGVKDYTLEVGLSDLEARYANIYRNKISSTQPLTDDEHVILCVFVAAQMARTRYAKKQLESFIDQMKEWDDERGYPTEYWEEMREDIHKQSLPSATAEVAKTLISMDLSFLVYSHPDASFITSDSPVTLFNTKMQWQRFYPHGLAYEHTELVMPISPDIAVCFSWQPLRGYITIQKGMVEELNRRIRSQCYKEFISHRKKPKRFWWSRYPLSFLFFLKIVRHKVKLLVFAIKRKMRRW